MGNIMTALNSALTNLRSSSDMREATESALPCGQLLGYILLIVAGKESVLFTNDMPAAEHMQPYLADLADEIKTLSRDQVLDATLGDVDIRKWSIESLLIVPAIDLLGQPIVIAWGGASDGSPAAHAILHSVAVQVGALCDAGDAELSPAHIDYLAAVCSGKEQSYIQQNNISARTVSRMRQAIKLAYGADSFSQVVATTSKSASMFSKRTRIKK